MPRAISETVVGSGVRAISVESGDVDILIVAPQSPSAYVLVRDHDRVLGHFTIGDLERLVARHEDELARARELRAYGRVRVRTSKEESPDEPSTVGPHGAEEDRGSDEASGS